MVYDHMRTLIRADRKDRHHNDDDDADDDSEGSEENDGKEFNRGNEKAVVGVDNGGGRIGENSLLLSDIHTHKYTHSHINTHKNINTHSHI